MYLLIKLTEPQPTIGLFEIARLRASRRGRGLELALRYTLAQAVTDAVRMWTNREWNFHIQPYFLTSKGAMEMNTKTKQEMEMHTQQETLLQAVLIELERMNGTLDIIAESLTNNTGPDLSVGPNFQRALPEYPTFDWETIGAEIVKWDRHGATVVKWQGLEFFRRRHTDYDASVCFCRYTGQKDENDRKVYARLITFSDRPRIVKSLPEEVAERLPDRAPVGSSVQEQPPEKAPANTPSRSSANDPQGSAKLPTDAKRSEAPAASSNQQPASSQPVDPRVAFYQLLPQLVRAGKLTTEAANQLTRRANQEGYPIALQAAQELSNVAADNPTNSSLASDPQDNTQSSGSERSSQGNTKSRSLEHSDKLRTAAPAAAAAEALYPKNELDDFFPRD